MPPRKKQKREIKSYSHEQAKRKNNPPVGLTKYEKVPETDEKQTYQYDPHLPPELQWSSKAEHTSFEVPTVSLHVHERIDPRTIIEATRKINGANTKQANLFDDEVDIPLRHAIEFYKHARNWSNRLIAGDSLLVMNSLLQKENMAGKVQCVYIDPPYGIKYGSNFQAFTNKRDVKDGKDDDLTAEPEMIKAFRDTWELGIHSYLSYMRDRLLLAKELLSDSGSCFVQISDENVHHIREIMDEVFGAKNFVALINFRKKTMPLKTKHLEQMCDYIIFYCKNKENLKYRSLFKATQAEGDSNYKWYRLPDGSYHEMTSEQIYDRTSLPKGAAVYRLKSLIASGRNPSGMFDYEFEGKTYKHPVQGYGTTIKGMKNLEKQNRIQVGGNTLTYRLFIEDYPASKLSANWGDTVGVRDKSYVVETNEEVISRCILMTTDPGDLVFDPTCGSGTTAYVAEQWGRRWITCDTSRVATALARQRLMTSTFDYYKLAYPDEGVGSGFEYETVPHVTLRSIANDEPPATETLYDKPFKDSKKARVTGPFTVEAVPSPTVRPIDHAPEVEPVPADETVVRSGATLRHSQWCDELLKAGIRGKNGQRISFSRIESLPGRHLHADAETKPNDSGDNQVREPAPAYQSTRAVISFGPEHGLLERRQVDKALDEAETLRPKPQMVIFAAFQFDPEAAKDIDETNWPNVTILKVQMNNDLQTEDLKKGERSSDSFWLIGQPDVEIRQIRKGELIGQWQVKVKGFDYFNTKTGQIESGDEKRIATWMLDTDYDGRSLYPRQVFFPMASDKEGWTKLARNLRAEIDEGLIELYRGTLSLPFELGDHSRIAVKIVDDRGIESLKVIDVITEKAR